MTDLRAALIEACDIGDALTGLVAKHGPGRDRAAIVDRRLADLRSLATSPLCVLDALRDPEVRAGRVWVAVDHGRTWLLQYRVLDGKLEDRTKGSAAGHWMPWGECVISLALLDSPCRLVPAEGDGG